MPTGKLSTDVSDKLYCQAVHAALELFALKQWRTLSTTNTSVTIYQSTWFITPQDLNIQLNCNENLKFRNLGNVSIA